MSAFIVSPEHINVMIHAGLDQHGLCYRLTWDVPGSNPARARQLSEQSADAVAQMLIEANTASVNHRYHEDETYVQGYAPPRHTWSHVEILKTISCYEYQSCEVPDWARTEACAFCAALRAWVITSLPGWDEAAWGIEPGSVPLANQTNESAGR